MSRAIPRYSQFLHIRDPRWRPRACGIVATKMLVDFLTPHGAGKISLDAFLEEGWARGAYLENIGWSHKGLAALARAHELYGKNYDWFPLTPEAALAKLRKTANTPFLASVHKHLDPNNGGHLVVVTRLTDTTVTYLDPVSRTQSGIARTASLKKFLHGWKRRIIVIRRKLQK